MNTTSASATTSADATKGFQRKVAVLSGAGMFLDGFDVSVIAVALPGLTAAWHITGVTTGIVASSSIVGMFLGMMIAGRLADVLGRRRMYMIDLIGFIVFAVLGALSQNVVELIAARFLLGLFIGADYPISSSLTAEFSAPRSRGKFIILMSLMWQVGALFAYLIGIAMLPIGADAWRWMLLVGAILAALTLVLRSNVPESPRWLRARGRIAEADAITQALTGQTSAIYAAPDVERKARWVELFSRRNIRATVFCSAFWFAFAVAFYGIQLYTPSILGPLTGGSTSLAYLGSAVISFLGVVGAAIGMSVVDRWGRRPLIIWCFVGMSVALVVLALSGNPGMITLTILLAVAILLANLGPGVLDMVYPNELFPTNLRAAGTGFAGAISRIGSILGVTVFPVLVASWGLEHAVWLFAVVAVFGLVVSIFLAPETKGRTLETLATDPYAAG